jgi:hypothetical protein
MKLTIRSLSLLLAAAALAAVALAGAAHAIVPPKECGIIKVGSHRYDIKSDQIPKCSISKAYAQALIAHHRRPAGYKCTHFTGSSLIWKCVNTRANPDRTLFVIKR